MMRSTRQEGDETVGVAEEGEDPAGVCYIHMAPEHGTELAYVYADWFGSSGVRAPVEDEIDWEFAQ
eukprot:2476405-Rhodomonas_salina.2